MKIVKRTLLVLLAVIITTFFYNYPRLNIISGYAAKNMASSVFIAQRTEVSINKKDNNIPLIKMAKTAVDSKSKQASSTVFGVMKRTAIYREGLGAVLINGTYDAKKNHPIPNRSVLKNSLPFPYGNLDVQDTVLENVDYNLINKALDNAFSSPDIKKTRTVIIVHKDQIIGERYIDGFSKDTKILGWSMSKSVLATIFGILEYQGSLNTNNLAAVTLWATDERKHITLNHLLRMQSGLEWNEDYTSISDVTKMLFLDSDMTLAQKEKKAIAKPTEIWNYSSGTSNLLSGILRKQFTYKQEYLDFPYVALIDKIGMHSMLLEADMEGNFVGSSYIWANTRDWAKFGLLYLHRGNWNGKRIFDDKWADYISKPTIGSNGTYGAHFWLNSNGKFPDVPRDLYSANGYQGQYVFIIPSKDLVVVRTGLAENPEFDVNKFLKEIIAAIN